MLSDIETKQSHNSFIASKNESVDRRVVPNICSAKKEKANADLESATSAKLYNLYYGPSPII